MKLTYKDNVIYLEGFRILMRVSGRWLVDLEHGAPLEEATRVFMTFYKHDLRRAADGHQLAEFLTNACMNRPMRIGIVDVDGNTYEHNNSQNYQDWTQLYFMFILVDAKCDGSINTCFDINELSFDIRVDNKIDIVHSDVIVGQMEYEWM